MYVNKVELLCNVSKQSGDSLGGTFMQCVLSEMTLLQISGK